MSKDCTKPVLITAVSNLGVRELVAGTNFAAALTDDCRVMVWGGGTIASPTKLDDLHLARGTVCRLSASAFHLTIVVAHLGSDVPAAVKSILVERSRLAMKLFVSERRYFRMLQQLVQQFLQPLLDAASGKLLEEVWKVFSPAFLKAHHDVVDSGTVLCRLLDEAMTESPTAQGECILAFCHMRLGGILKNIHQILSSLSDYAYHFAEVCWTIRSCTLRNPAAARFESAELAHKCFSCVAWMLGLLMALWLDGVFISKVISAGTSSETGSGRTKAKTRQSNHQQHRPALLHVSESHLV